MKKISRLVTILVLATSFSMPFLVSAACPLYTHQDMNNTGVCIPDSPSTLTTPPSAQTTVAPSQGGSVNQEWLVYYYNTILWAVNSILVPVLIAIAFITFLWGAFKYFIWGAENEHEKADGRKFALWGIIGFVIIMSVWGIVNIVKDTLIPTTARSTHPNYPTL